MAASEKYDFTTRESWERWLEEHTTAARILTGAEMHIDLLMPIKLRKEKRKAIKLGYIEDSETKCGFKASVIKKKAFTVAGFTTIHPGSVPHDDFYAELAGDGRLERLKAALKPGVPLLIFQSKDGECGDVEQKLGCWCFRQTVCADLNDFIDLDTFMTEDVFIQKLPPKHWIEFDFTRELRKKISEGKAENTHSLVQKLNWRFSGIGHFDIYNDREIFTDDENKNELIHFWMPVVPLK